MKALIIAGGEKPSKELLESEAKNSDVLIAADKGVEAFLINGFTPDYALGDFDSISEEFKERLKDLNIERFNPEKDNTDTEIAFLKAINLGATEIAFLGVTGTRLDHVLANLGLLRSSLEKGIEAYIIDNNNKIMLKNKSTILKNEFGDYISFQAFGESVDNFSIKSSKYPLSNHKLLLGDSLCVSNEFVDEYMEISFEKGEVLVIYSRD
ncbi:thiamine diphosphokinase [Clostridium sp. B9]|uniref:thiamine diphosphokinase n=1 Tax=Clostridium sp. B9 TaxID=3423224 RepID=UPI003D2F0EFA